jgi:2-hydroxychromene-2-carboxylate isomerase
VDLFDEMTRVSQALEAAGIEYAWCGAIALAIHGVPRATKDIDVLVQAADLERFREVARRCGFTVVALPMTFASSGITMHRFTKLAEGTSLMLDAIVADDTLAAVWNDRTRLPYSEGSVSVVSRAGLVTLKLAAGRPQDLVDVQRLAEVPDEDADG